MKVYQVHNNTSFGRALTTKERQKMECIQKEALEKLGCKNISIIMPVQSFPTKPELNTGVGQINSEYSQKFLDFMKSYAGINGVKTLPLGEYGDKATKKFCAYKTSPLSTGSYNINLEKLTHDDMGKILSKETFEKVVKTAEHPADKSLVNFENIVRENSPFEEALKEAFDNFNKSQDSTVKNLQEKFGRYKTENKKFLERNALFEALAEKYKISYVWNWESVDRDLFNPDYVSEEQKIKRIAEIHEQHGKAIDFAYFKQFLADMNIEEARKNLNKKGLKLMGDCQVGFSDIELWAYPKAFEDASIGWSLRALDYSNITNPTSESNKLLKLKVERSAKLYDGIRFDVGWSYVNPAIHQQKNHNAPLGEKYRYDSIADCYRTKEPIGDSLLKQIEETVREVKGKDYNTDNLIYEIEASPKDFSVYDWHNRKVIDAFKGRTIVQSNFYMDENYATIDMSEKQMKIPRKNYVYMSGNHDHLALNSYANLIDTNDMLKKQGDDIKILHERQCKVLATALNLDEKVLRETPKEFVKAKNAYVLGAENIKMFFMDIFGRTEQFDPQDQTIYTAYKYKVPTNYEESFHTAIQDGSGFNIMDSIEKSMRAKGLDKTDPELYNKVRKYRDILYEKGVKTEFEANKLAKNKLIKKVTLITLGILTLTGGIFAVVKNKNAKSKS